jgi:transposase InsO family protein
VVLLDKSEIRREFIKLKNKEFSYNKCKTILMARFEYIIDVRTLKRWYKKFLTSDWDLSDQSRRPHTIHRKITPEIISDVLALRDKTGWGQEKLSHNLIYLGISERSIKRIIKENFRCRETKSKGKRIKWVRWQRQHPNSLWQIDHTDELDNKKCYTFSVIDDCSRYSLALVKLKQVTTNSVTLILDDLIKKFGKPKQILSDNGSAYGSKSKHSRFDRWCRRRDIRHIRTKIHSPTTNGKVERLFKTMDDEMQYCNNDLEQFRLRYNHFRPHGSLKGKTPSEKYNDFRNYFN